VWLSKIPKSELDFVWRQLRFAIEADPGLGFNWSDIEAAVTSKNAVNTFVRVIARHPRKADIIALAHSIALKYSVSYKAHVANAGLVNFCISFTLFPLLHQYLSGHTLHQYLGSLLLSVFSSHSSIDYFWLLLT
jgi:hypothetical protein